MGNMWFPPENIEATNEFGKKQRIYIYIYIPYGSKYLLRKCLGHDLGG